MNEVSSRIVSNNTSGNGVDPIQGAGSHNQSEGRNARPVPPVPTGAVGRTVVFSGTVPDPDTAEKNYEQVLRRLDDIKPGTAAYLRGLLGRVRTAVEKRKDVERAVFAARSAAEKNVQAEINALRSRRDAAQNELGAMLKQGVVPAIPKPVAYVASEPPTTEAQTTGAAAAPGASAPGPMGDAAQTGGAPTADGAAPAAPETSVGAPQPGFLKRAAAATQAVFGKKPAGEGASEEEQPPAKPGRARHTADATDLDVLAAGLGLLPGSPAAEVSTHRFPFAIRAGRGLVIACCGAIFGLSLAIITHAVDMKLLSAAPMMVMPTLIPMVALGTCLFWCLGRIVFQLAALASEERHTAWLARCKKDGIEKTASWLARSGAWTFGILAVVAIAMCSMDACVERFGIIRLFADADGNRGFVAGAIQAHSAPNPIAIIALSLIASTPVAFMEMIDGWIHARERCIRTYMRVQYALADNNRSLAEPNIDETAADAAEAADTESTTAQAETPVSEADAADPLSTPNEAMPPEYLIESAGINHSSEPSDKQEAVVEAGSR